jgi:hypothetical protein
MKLLFYTLFFCLLLFSCSKKGTGTTDTPPVQPPALPAATFRVEGTKILDANGQEFIAKGTNVNGPYWPWPRATIPDVPLIADIWKCNTVRLNTWPEFSIYNSNNTDMDGIVKAFTDKKVVVMIEQHNFTGKYPTAAELVSLTNYWTAIAGRYKNNGYVWFNIMNEPGNGGDVPAEWLTTHETVIKAIRNAGAPNIIVLDEHQFGQANGFDKAASSGALTYGATLAAKYPNLLFSLHLYSNWIYGKERLERYVDAVHAKNLALIIGEYGTANDYSMEVATTVFKVGLAKKIGRLSWAWAGDDIHDLVTTGNGGGFNINNTSGAKPTNLSFVGNLVWMDNHGELTSASPALVPPPVIVYNPGFEVGSPAGGSKLDHGWINFGTAFIESSPEHVKAGSFSVKIKEGERGGAGQPIYLEPGGTYRLTAWGKHSQPATAPSNVLIKGRNGAGGPETTFGTLNFTANSFEQKTTTFTVPDRLSDVLLIIYKNDAAPAFWCDDIRVEKL